MTAEGLGNAVHRFALSNRDRFVGGAIVKVPRGYDEYTALGTEGNALLGGMVDSGEAVICYQNDGIIEVNGFINDCLFASGYAGRDQNDSFGSSSKTCLLLLSKEA